MEEFHQRAKDDNLDLHGQIAVLNTQMGFVLKELSELKTFLEKRDAKFDLALEENGKKFVTKDEFFIYKWIILAVCGAVIPLVINQLWKL